MKSDLKTYVMYGYNLADEDDTAYFGQNLEPVTAFEAAKRFYSKKVKGQKGFGSPEQWLDFINADPEVNHGFKFHLVPVLH